MKRLQLIPESALTPIQVVEALDRYIIGQPAAKRVVAVALRNRMARVLWRRPKNGRVFLLAVCADRGSAHDRGFIKICFFFLVLCHFTESFG